MLELTELFHSLQGEGPYAGLPAVFVRLSRCLPPLCPWCDTAYAWQPGTMVEPEELLKKILDYGCQLVVITGGEPFLQWAEGLQDLEQLLVQKGCQVQYETSGKLPIPKEARGRIICSPKFLDNSWHFVPANLTLVDAFKFVAEDDFRHIDDFIERWQLPADKVWIMPKGVSRRAQLQHAEAIWNYCVRRGFRFSPRLHILTFGNERGV